MKKVIVLTSLCVFALSSSFVMAVPLLVDNFGTDLSQWNTSANSPQVQVSLDVSGNLLLGFETNLTTYKTAAVVSKQAVDVASDEIITMTTRIMYPAANTNNWWAKTYSRLALTPNSNGSLGNSLVFTNNMENYNDSAFTMTFSVLNSAGAAVKVYDDELAGWSSGVVNGKNYEITMSLDRAGNSAALSIYNLTDSVLVGSTSFVYSGFTESAAYYATLNGEVKTTDATKSLNTGFKVDSITVVPEPTTIALLGLSSGALFLKRRK